MKRQVLIPCLALLLIGMWAQPGVSTGAARSLGSNLKVLPSGRPIPAMSHILQSDNLSAVVPVTPATGGCSLIRVHRGRPDNVRVNQDCGATLQGEEWVDLNPTDPSNVVVSQNDQQFGYNVTSVSPSLNNGSTFYRNYAPPGLNKTPTSTGGQFDYPRCSDPASTFDGKGNYFYTCVAFTVPYGPETAIPVWRSNHCYKATFLHNPADKGVPCDELAQNQTPALVVDNQSNFNISWDKQFMDADRSAKSPFYGNVYVTATGFNLASKCGGYCESPIHFFKSTDGGVTWTGRQISGVNEDICIFGDAFNPNLNPNRCNFDQGSFPVVEKSGAIDVVFNNTNTPTLVAQQLFVRSTDGGDHWSKPVKVGDDFDLQPFNTTNAVLPNGCAPFRQCLPPNGYRQTDFPAMGIDRHTGKLAVYWSDFRNGGPCATDPATGLPTTPCDNYNNDVFVALSKDHGHTWGQTKQVSNGGISAQWQPWGDVGENGKLYVGYYDRQFHDCEVAGCNDITLATSSTNGNTWQYRRITTSSMPNLVCADNQFECGFLGDYMSTRYFGTQEGGTLYLVWADTRPRVGTIPEEDVYFAKLSVT